MTTNLGGEFGVLRFPTIDDPFNPFLQNHFLGGGYHQLGLFLPRRIWLVISGGKPFKPFKTRLGGGFNFFYVHPDPWGNDPI